MFPVATGKRQQQLKRWRVFCDHGSEVLEAEAGSSWSQSEEREVRIRAQIASFPVFFLGEYRFIEGKRIPESGEGLQGRNALAVQVHEILQ